MLAWFAILTALLVGLSVPWALVALGHHLAAVLVAGVVWVALEKIPHPPSGGLLSALTQVMFASHAIAFVVVTWRLVARALS
jgi:hypothetical protein